MSLCSYVSTNSELQADTSTPSTSGTSGVHDIQMAETCSLSSDDKVTSRDLKSSDETTSKSPTPKGILSAKSQCSTGYGGSPMFSHSCRRSIPPSRQSSTKSLLHITDFERNFFSEDYVSGEDSGEEDDYASIDPSVIVVASPSVSYLGVSKYKDFIRCLPVHLSKYIFSLLDKNSLTNCLCISKHWRLLAEEVQKDFLVHQLMTEEVMLMQVSLTYNSLQNFAHTSIICLVPLLSVLCSTLHVPVLKHPLYLVPLPSPHCSTRHIVPVLKNSLHLVPLPSAPPPPHCSTLYVPVPKYLLYLIPLPSPLPPSPPAPCLTLHVPVPNISYIWYLCLHPLPRSTPLLHPAGSCAQTSLIPGASPLFTGCISKRNEPKVCQICPGFCSS